MQSTSIEMHQQKRTASSWLILCLSKLLFFSKLGLVIWSCLTLSAQVPSLLNLNIFLQLNNFPMKVLLTTYFMSDTAFYGLCPLAIYLVSSTAAVNFKIKDMSYPQYWYLLLLGAISECIYFITSIYSYTAKSTYITWLVILYNFFMSMILAFIIGSSTSTLTKRCFELTINREDDFAGDGKILLRDFRALKECCQLGMFIGIVFQTTSLVLMVSLANPYFLSTSTWPAH